MKQNDSIEELFGRLQGSLDLESPPAGHRERFRERLREGGDTGDKEGRGSWWRHLSIAASIALLLSASLFLWQREPSLQERVAEAAPEVSQTTRHFAGIISRQVTELKQMGTPETAPLIEDTLRQLEALEKDYTQMEADLLAGGNSKLILSAMIQNFQTRIDLLTEVMERIEEVKQFKNQTNEDYIL